MLKLTLMAKITNHLPVTHWVFYDKRSLVSVSVDTQKFETNFFLFSFMEKMLLIQFNSMGKCLSYNFIIWKKAFFCYFIHLLFLYEIV